MKEKDQHKAENHRPFLLSLLCITLFVYSATLIAIFLAFLIFHDWLTGVIIDYFDFQTFSRNNLILVNAFGLFIHLMIFYSTYLLWKLKKIGYYLLFAALVILPLVPFIFSQGSWFSVIIYGLMLLFISFFYKRYH